MILNVFIILILVFQSFSCIKKEKTDLEYWSIGGSADLDYDPSELFNKNFDFTFKTISIPWTEHEKKILTSILSGDPPDVISEFAPLKSWASRASLQPLDKFIEESNFDTNQFFSSLWGEMIWENQTFGIPVNTVSYALFYNKKIFADVGIDTVPETWNDIIRFSREIDRFNSEGFLDRVGYLPNYGNLKTSNIIAWQLEHKFIDDDGEVNLNSNEMRTAFHWVKDFINEIGLKNVLELMGTFGTGPQHGFISEKVSMMILDSSYPEIIEKYNPSLQYGVIPIPTFDDSGPVSSAGIWWLGIPRGAKNPQKSWKFISYLAGEKNQIDYQEKTEESLFSANKAAAYQSDYPTIPFYDVFLSMLENSKTPNIIPLAHDKFWVEYHRAEERVIRTNVSIHTILNEAENEIQRELVKSKRYYEYLKNE